MHKISHNFIGGGVVIALSSLFVNTALADSTGDRLTAYKGNKLIPQGITLPTADMAKSGTEQVVVFETSSLSWNSESAAIASFANYMGLTKEDWESVGKFFARDSEHDSEWFAKALQYLGKIQSGELTNPNLTPEDVQNLNDGKGVIIADQAMIECCTIQPPFPKAVFEGSVKLNDVAFKDGIPDWDWEKAGMMTHISFSGMKSSDLAKFTGAGYDFQIGNIIVDDLTYPPMIQKSQMPVFTADCPLAYQIAVAKQNTNTNVRFDGDFTNVDMSGDEWGNTVGTFDKANETLLGLSNANSLYVENMKLRKEPEAVSSGFKSYSHIEKLDCTAANIGSTAKLPQADCIILTKSQFDSLKSQILSSDYDTENTLREIWVKNGNSVDKYSVSRSMEMSGGQLVVTRTLNKY